MDAACELGRHADLVLGTGAADHAQLAEIVDALQPVSKVAERSGRALGDSHRQSPTPPVPGRGVQLANGYTTGGPRRAMPAAALLQEAPVQSVFHERIVDDL